MVAHIWKFYVQEGHENDICEMNRKDWPELFRKSPHYFGTTFTLYNGVLWAFDRWTSEEKFKEFVRENKADFDDLCAKHAKHYESEKDIGFYHI